MTLNYVCIQHKKGLHFFMDQLNVFPWYQMMRATNPVAFNPEYNSWSVFRYTDVQRVLSEHASFSSQFIGSDQPLDSSIITTDPPRHRQLRSLATQAFTPRVVAQLSTRITTIVHDLLDKVVAQGSMDVINDLAYPLPVTVIAEMLGVPIADRERFKHWSDEVVGATNTSNVDPQVEMGVYFTDLIEQRRREPREDLITDLLNAQIDGQHLTLNEILGFCVLLLVAGNETTTHLITNAILCLDEHPEALEQLRAEPALLPDAIEEVLRYRSPIRLMHRVVATDTTIGEHKLKKGQNMIAWIASANRDEEQFPHADQFDIRRSPNRHLAFGYGIHF